MAHVERKAAEARATTEEEAVGAAALTKAPEAKVEAPAAEGELEESKSHGATNEESNSPGMRRAILP